MGRADVVAVVGGDPLQDVVVALDQPAFVGDDRRQGIGDVVGLVPRTPGSSPVEGLELLDGITALADPQTLADNAVEVDEHLAPQQAVELALGHSVTLREPL